MRKCFQLVSSAAPFPLPPKRYISKRASTMCRAMGLQILRVCFTEEEKERRQRSWHLGRLWLLITLRPPTPLKQQNQLSLSFLCVTGTVCVSWWGCSLPGFQPLTTKGPWAWVSFYPTYKLRYTIKLHSGLVDFWGVCWLALSGPAYLKNLLISA
jgi:hypothetical protein